MSDIHVACCFDDEMVLPRSSWLRRCDSSVQTAARSGFMRFRRDHLVCSAVLPDQVVGNELVPKLIVVDIAPNEQIPQEIEVLALVSE